MIKVFCQANNLNNSAPSFEQSGDAKETKARRDNRYPERDGLSTIREQSLKEMDHSIQHLHRRTDIMTELLRSALREIKYLHKGTERELSYLELNRVRKQCLTKPMQALEAQEAELGFSKTLDTTLMSYLQDVNADVMKCSKCQEEIMQAVDVQTVQFRKLKKNLIKLCKGIWKEHAAILAEADGNKKKFHQMSHVQFVLHQHVGDVKKGVEETGNNLAVVKQRVSEQELTVERNHQSLKEKIAGVGAEATRVINDHVATDKALFEKLEMKLCEIVCEVTKLDEGAKESQKRLNDLANDLRQHRDEALLNMRSAEDQIRSETKLLMEPTKPLYNELRERVRELQYQHSNTLEGIQKNSETLEKLSNDLEHYKKRIEEEAKRLEKDIETVLNDPRLDTSSIQKEVTKQLADLAANLMNLQDQLRDRDDRAAQADDEWRARLSELRDDLKKAKRDHDSANVVREHQSHSDFRELASDLDKLADELANLHQVDATLRGLLDNLEHASREKVEGLGNHLASMEREVRSDMNAAQSELRATLEDTMARIRAATEGMHQHVEEKVDRSVSIHVTHQSSKYLGRIDDIRRELQNTATTIKMNEKEVGRNFYLLILVMVLLGMLVFTTFLKSNHDLAMCKAECIEEGSGAQRIGFSDWVWRQAEWMWRYGLNSRKSGGRVLHQL